MIHQTLRGDDKSMGACVIAFLLVSNRDSLKKVSENQRLFIFDIAEIIELRGHGNKSMPRNKEKIKELRKSVYKTIKTLLEVEEWE
jgi:hypothetical protein